MLVRVALLPLVMALAVSPALAKDTMKNGATATTTVGEEPELAPDEQSPAETGAPASTSPDWALWVPPTDGSFSTWGDTPPELGLVKRVFSLSFAEECSWALGASLEGIADPEVYDITYREPYDAEADPDRVMKLYRFFCNAGAYNEIALYMSWDSSFGLRPVLFAQPRLDVKYENDNDFDGKVTSITIIGYTSSPTLVNSWYDPATQAIYSDSKWRGLADASSQGRYSFREGTFILDRYDVDASYDGEFNSFRIIDAAENAAVQLVPVEPDYFPAEEE
jgi:hypothetical protein